MTRGGAVDIHDPVDHLECPERIREIGCEALWELLVSSLAHLGSLTHADAIYLECLVFPLESYHHVSREAAATENAQARAILEQIAAESLSDARRVFEEYQQYAYEGFGAQWYDWARLWNDLIAWDRGGGWAAPV